MNIIKGIDFKTLALKLRIKRLRPYVVRYVLQYKRNPPPLNSLRPLPSMENVEVVEGLWDASVHWPKLAYERVVAYARAGMHIKLCEKAACRDLVMGLESMEKACPHKEAKS